MNDDTILKKIPPSPLKAPSTQYKSQEFKTKLGEAQKKKASESLK